MQATDIFLDPETGFGRNMVGDDQGNLANWKRVERKEKEKRKLAAKITEREEEIIREDGRRKVETHMVVAALIATITFAAAFTIPGGYNSNQGDPELGMAVLAKAAAFKVFLVTNTIAVVCSVSSLFLYVFASLFYFDRDKQAKRYVTALGLILVAMVAMMLAFIAATFAVLAQYSVALAVLTCLVACIPLLVLFHELVGLVRVYKDNSEYDLSAIPGGAICQQKQSSERENGINKRIKTSNSSRSDDSVLSLPPEICGSAAVGKTRPVVLVDSQETGILLVHTLMACAETVQQENLNLADALVKHIGLLAVAQAGAMRKVATYFAEALARRIYKIYPQDLPYSDLLQMHFYETCPYLKFAHFTANQAILEAFDGATRVHVVDFSLKQGMQWPALMQALALRPGGPPAFRLTGIGPPQPDNTDALQEVGWKLAQLAETIGVEFEFRGFVANSLADLDASMLDIRPSEVEAVAVNSVFELHRLLSRPGAIEKVLSSIKAMRPKIVTVVEQEANHNGPVFLDRFNEALHYYSTMFDSLESSGLTQPNSQDLVMSEVYLGRQICNVVACEGTDRVERHETLSQWRARMGSAGFDPAHLGSNAFKQASMLLALFAGGDGYRVEENDGCLMLGWHTRPLIATSAWQLAAAESL